MRVLVLSVLGLLVQLSAARPQVFTFNQDFLNLEQEKEAKPNLMEESDSKCGYQSCNLGKEGMLNVHLVPHTHDDVGWLKTVDQYFYGAHNEIQHAAVQYILDSVIQQLLLDPNRRFIYVEIAFFYRWWNQQDEKTRQDVKMLVQEGRLEFILGGWCMNDEASTHYNAIIDQHTRGFMFLKENFGECGRPRIGWQIDPFGHSREQASLFAQFGFDGLFFGRLDFEDKDWRLNNKTMEMMWKASDNLGPQASLFTGVNYNMYQNPPSFCFDIWCADTPIMDDPRLHDYNVDQRVDDFIKAAQDQAKHYRSGHIMMTMGSDFQWENARENYHNLDKLIKYVNERQSKGSKVNTFYSTPSCYTYAINKANLTLTTKSDDFFPYASRGHTFWTGYFTSRPALKGYVRSTNNFLQVCKQLGVLARLDPADGSVAKMDVLRRAMGVAQHHDAVSGTEKQAVAYDYAERIAAGIQECQDVVNSAMGKVMQESSTPAPKQEFCQLTNVSYCTVSEQNKQFTVTLYNPIGRMVSHWVRVPVSGSNYMVTGPDMTTVKSQIVPLSAATKAIPAHNGSIATGELVFAASLPPLGYKTFFVQQQAESEVMPPKEEDKQTSDVVLENQYLSLTFDGATGLLKSAMNIPKKLSMKLSQTLLYYQGFKGDNHNGTAQSSGAYVFRPNGSDPLPINKTITPTLEYIKGSQVQEVRQVYSSWASQVFRLYDNAQYAEVEWTVGPIPVGEPIGKEVISRYSSDMDSKATFYTDANGRQILERVRDYRPTWKLNQTEEVAGNYYPVNSRIYIRDSEQQRQLTILTDRSQGGGSIKDGSVELMVHRRLIVDDSFGVGEALNETGITGKGLVVRGKHYLLFDTVEASGALHRDLGEKLFMSPSVSYSPLTMSPQDYAKDFKAIWSGMNMRLPDNVHLLTLEQWEDNTILLRLEHFYEKGEDPKMSQPATVSLQTLFNTFKISSVEELVLGANAKASDVKRLKWRTQDGITTPDDMSSGFSPVSDDLTITLEPMQIRTFQITVM